MDEDLRITIEVRQDDRGPYRVIARFETVSLALAAFDEAMRQYPSSMIWIRDRARIIRRSDRAD